jgi:membrane associated rhomboid family serine protease
MFPMNGPMRSEMVMSLPPWTRWVKILTIAHVVLYIVWLSLGRWGAAPSVAEEMVLVPGSVLEGHAWQLVSYIVPTTPMGIFLFGVLLWMFGGELERRWGARRFLTFYFGVTIAAAGLLSLLALVLAPLRAIPVFGTDALLLALVIAWGIIYAERQILFMFVLPLKGRTVVLLSLGVTALYAFASQPMAFVIHAFTALCAATIVIVWRRYGGVLISIRMYFARVRARRARSHLRSVDDGDRRTLH